MLRFLVRLTGACIAFSLAWRFIGRTFHGATLFSGLPLIVSTNETAAGVGSDAFGSYVVTITTEKPK